MASGATGYPMSAPRSATPDSCPCCPHYDPFHGACHHPLHQDVVRALADGSDDGCPLYASIRAEAMRTLEARLG